MMGTSVAVVAAVAVTLLVTRVGPPAVRWARRRWSDRREMTRDHCAVCGRQLPVSGRWEVASVTLEMDAGRATVADYCRRHRPRHAVKA